MRQASQSGKPASLQKYSFAEAASLQEYSPLTMEA